MTVRLSPHKVSSVLRLFFVGMPQPDIARKAGVDQSTVSIYASRFRRRTEEVGLLIAGKEFGVLNEVSALRSLSVELTEARLTVEEAKEGLRIIKIFMELGIDPEEHIALVKVCKDIDDPGFVQAAVKLSKVEADTGMSYEDTISRFESATSGLLSTEKKVKEARTDLEAINTIVAQRKHEVAGLESRIAQLQKEAESKEAQFEQELTAKIKHLRVKEAEVEGVAALKKQLSINGLDVPTLIKLAKEFGHGSK